MNETLRKAKAAVRDAKRIVFLGGAGVSTNSGIPDFRSPEGIYRVHSEYGVSYETMLSHDYFESHTSTFYDFYWSHMVSLNAKPNQAHLALARAESSHRRIAILTQNIDGLHQDAGSSIVYELHGSTRRYVCQGCDSHYALNEILPSGVPHCKKCGGILKPDVVLYGEALDEEVLLSSVNEMRYADVLIVGGTSLNVFPAAGLIDYFVKGAKIIINKEETLFDSRFDFVFHQDIGETLTELLS